MNCPKCGSSQLKGAGKTYHLPEDAPVPLVCTRCGWEGVLEPQEIFVFGSNREGRHGKGAALEARQKYGAVYGQAEGLQGNSYAVVTKELRRGQPRVKLTEVAEGVERFKRFAASHPEMAFNVMKIGCGLAGFTPAEIAPLFAGCPDNVKLPPEFREVLNQKGMKP